MSWDPRDQGSGQAPTDPWAGTPQGAGPQSGQWQQPGPQGGQWQQPPQGGQWQQPGAPGAQPDPWGPPPPPGGWGPPPPPPPVSYDPNAQQWTPPPGPGQAWWGPQPIPDPYPVNVSFARRDRITRFWGIPIIFPVLRMLVLFPHFIVLPFVGIGVWLVNLFTWIPILASGRYPRIGYRWVGGYLRWIVRLAGWGLLLTSAYPPFSLQSDEHPIRVRIDEGRPINRLWGIPLVGFVVRWVLLLPHWIVIWVLAMVAAILTLFAWIPVLVTGRQADLIYTVVGGYLRWYARVFAYLMLFAVPYPPFTLGEDDPAPVW